MTNRVEMNAAIDDVDFGIGRGALMCLFVDLRSAPLGASTASRADRLRALYVNNSKSPFPGHALSGNPRQLMAIVRALKSRARGRSQTPVPTMAVHPTLWRSLVSGHRGALSAIY